MYLRYQRSIFTLLLPLLSGLLVSCTQPKVTLHPSERHFNPADYEKVFENWSREIIVLPFNGMENVLTARATYRSHEFRRYYAARVAADLALTSTETAETEALEIAAMKEGHEFYVTLTSAVVDCKDLTPKEGPWTIRLKNDRGMVAAPIAVEEVQDPLPEDLKYYRFDSKLRKAYRIRFPMSGKDGTALLDDATQFFELSFASALGRDTARWETYRH